MVRLEVSTSIVLLSSGLGAVSSAWAWAACGKTGQWPGDILLEGEETATEEEEEDDDEEDEEGSEEEEDAARAAAASLGASVKLLGEGLGFVWTGRKALSIGGDDRAVKPEPGATPAFVGLELAEGLRFMGDAVACRGLGEGPALAGLGRSTATDSAFD